ncbi:Type-1 glutamine synthetase 2 [Psilocybe cubensis]|uniref:Type-1 glutamine synthetase 2 n=1 Tax=Psilocybe cubensis TaxID=181762 RepID=A0ACB8HA75_PSICU|nr:Type-1 glutamine synthetase 2 [Psilocybe cubensis]KAH9484376.1 Type-1 glutamine synthetase 2 [Psilocybe cubensis]
MSPTQIALKSFDELKEALNGEPKIKVADYVNSGWDIHDAVYSKELLISNKANGYRDITAIIDLSSFRRIPWERNVPFFLVSFLDPDTKAPLPVDPRGVLKLTTDQADSMGYQCYSGVETQLNNDYFHDLFDESLKFDVQIEGHHTETGPGVLETALAYTSALRMADNAILFKYIAKSVGMKHGIIPSFMAKPWGGLPGCSGHVHVSLRNKKGRNIFAVTDEELKSGRPNATNEDTKFISQEAEWFLAGILDGIADVMPAVVPTINGYKRLVGGEAFWAPNAVTYGYDSRAASIRIISPPSCPPAGTRMEVRIPGADMNPYFALSAIFRLGLRGINKKLALPGPPITHFSPEDRSNGKIKMLPTSLESATARMMRPDSIAREPEVFGNDFVDHYGGTREHEVKLWNEAVTNWEVERYLELA